MERGDFTRFSEEFGKVCAVFGREQRPELMQGWWVGLRDFPLDEVIGAFETLIEKGERMPVPGDAIEWIRRARKAELDARYDARAAADREKYDGAGYRPFTRAEMVGMLEKMRDSGAGRKLRANVPPGFTHISDCLAAALAKLPMIEATR